MDTVVVVVNVLGNSLLLCDRDPDFEWSANCQMNSGGRFRKHAEGVGLFSETLSQYLLSE